MASGYYGPEADVYSLGMSLRELLDVRDVPGVADVLSTCLAADPAARPRASALYGDLLTIIVRAAAAASCCYSVVVCSSVTRRCVLRDVLLLLLFLFLCACFSCGLL